MRSASCTASASSGASCATSRTARPTRAAGSRRRRPAASAWGSSRGTRSITCARTRRADGELERPDAQRDRDPDRRTARPGVRPRARRRAVGRPAPPLRPVAWRSSGARTEALVADFIARRPLIGVLGLGLPVTWRSRTWSEPATRRLRFVHVAGATKGMDVTWRIEADGGDGGDGLPRSRSNTNSRPGCRASPRSSIASSRGRSPAGPWPRSRPSPRRSRGVAVRTAAADESIDMSDRRRVWITGIGLVTPIGTGVDAFRAGLRAARSPIKRIDRFDASAFRSQVAAQVDDFDPLAWMPPKTARQLDRFSQFGMVAGRLALDDARLTRARTARPSRSASGSISVRRSGASPTPRSSTSATSRRGSARSPRTSRWRSSAARPRPISASRSTSAARSCRRPTRAPRARSRWARRSVTCARAASTPRSPAAARSRCRPLAFGAFDIIRALSAGHNDEPERAARPFDIGRDGFVMGEGAALLVLEDAEAAERRGATPYAELLGYGATSDAHHMVQPRADGREAARAASIALAGRGHVPRRHRLRQRARVLDADRRRGRGAGDRARPWASAPGRSR